MTQPRTFTDADFTSDGDGRFYLHTIRFSYYYIANVGGGWLVARQGAAGSAKWRRIGKRFGGTRGARDYILELANKQRT